MIDESKFDESQFYDETIMGNIDVKMMMVYNNQLYDQKGNPVPKELLAYFYKRSMEQAENADEDIVELAQRKRDLRFIYKKSVAQMQS